MAKKRRPRSPLEEAWNGISHIRIRVDMLNSPAYRVLPYSTRALYTDLRATLTSTNNGNISATFEDLKHRGWKSSATLAKALRELEHMGLIAKTRQGGIASLSKVCNLYRFTDLFVFEHPKQGIPAMKATFDWQRFKSVGAAQAHLQELGAARARRAAQNKTKLQKAKFEASETKAISRQTAANTEHEVAAKVQILKSA